MSETPDWDYSKRPVHEIDTLRAENAKLRADLAKERSDSLQHHHAWMSVEEMLKEAKKELEATKLKISEERGKWRGVLAMAERAMAAHPCNVELCSCRELRERFAENREGLS